VLRILASFGIAILTFSLGFSTAAYAAGLARNGLLMTILAVGTCMSTASAAQAKWTAPWVLRPVVKLGQRSYEIYLTHMFVVFGLFELFVLIGKPIAAVPALFTAVILVSGLSGEMVAHFIPSLGIVGFAESGETELAGSDQLSVEPWSTRKILRRLSLILH
jgi:peptidoglycan/LPS O-acetylase OafA/YrhL